MKIFLCLSFLILIAPTLFGANGKMVQYPSGSEQLNGYYVKPAGNGPFPALVVIHEWWGLNDQIKGTADRLASQGYAALAVDLYRGKATADADEAHQLMMSLPEDRAVADLKAAFAYLQAQKEIKKNSIGSIGWCMGGGYSLQLALNQPDLAACVIYYGRLVTDPEALKKINAPILGIFGGQDKPLAEMAPPFEQKMKEGGKKVEIHIYPDAGHGFFNETGKNYNAADAKDAWAKTLEFLKAHLK